MSFNEDLEKQVNTSDASQGTNEGFPRVDHELTHKSFHHDDEHIYINNVPIRKDDFTQAFGGTFEVGPRRKTKLFRTLGNPIPAGLGCFASSAMSIGLVQMHARGVTEANVLIGAFLTTSGLGEIIVGILCFIIGNGWACCTFIMFGGFWSSYAFVLMDIGNMSAAYETEEQYAQAIALFFCPWAIFAFWLWTCTWKSTFALSLLIFLIWFFVFLFTIAQFIGSVRLYKAGGFFAIFAGVVGFYNMTAGMAEKTNTYFTLSPLPLPNQAKPEDVEDD